MPDKDLEAIVQQMIDSGSSQDDIAHVVQAFDDQQHPVRAAMGGALEGVVPGVLGALTAPWYLAKGVVVDALSMAQGNTPKNAKALLDSIGELPKRWNAGGPRERAEMVSELLTSAGTGAAVGMAAPTNLPKAGAAVGRAIEATGKKASFPIRIMGGGMVTHGLTSADPLSIGGGLAAMTVPDMLVAGGRKLQRMAGVPEPPAPGTIRLAAQRAAKLDSLDDKFATALSKKVRTAETAAEEASANAARTRQFEAAKAGRVPQTSVSETVVADTPLGQGAVRIAYKKPKPVMSGLDADRAALKQRYPKMADEAINKLLEQQGAGTPAPAVTTASPISIDTAQQGFRRRAADIVPDDLEGVRPGIPREMVKSSIQEGQAAGVPDNPVAQRLEAERQAIEDAHLTGEGKLPLSGNLPPTRSSGALRSGESEMSATPGLTRADVQAIGLNPDNPIKSLTQEMIDKINAARAERETAHRINAGLDAGFRRATDLDEH